MSHSLPSITYEPLFDDVEPPVRATQGAAGYDVKAYLRDRAVRVFTGAALQEVRTDERGLLPLPAGHIALVPTGFKARLPHGWEAQVRIRSSIAFKKGLVIPNAPGTIDADYPDEWMVMLKNDGPATVTIEHGERIAQIVLAQHGVLEWTPGRVVISTDRGGGFGSTG
jgi:dUTP pyrophosphatase